VTPNTVLEQAKEDASFAYAVAKGMQQLRIAGEWTIADDGLSAYRPRLHANGVVCHMRYEVNWDAGEPVYGYFAMLVGNTPERHIVHEGFYPPTSENLAPHLQQAMARADEMARAQGWSVA
jgi:hypothetical protein